MLRGMQSPTPYTLPAPRLPSLLTGAVLGGEFDRTFTTYTSPSLTPSDEFDGTDFLSGHLAFSSNFAFLSGSAGTETLTLPVLTDINVAMGDGPAIGSTL